MKTVLVILGTRPEVIKLAPVILELKKCSDVNVLTCNTEQQKELTCQTLSFFGLQADINLNVMVKNQTLAELQARMLAKLESVFAAHSIDATIVQGDTMSVFCGALVSYYHRVPIFHVEAGLRSFRKYEPFPEEGLRQMVARVTDIHFAPTAISRQNLLDENVDETSIYITGNTVVDALHYIPEEKLAKPRGVLSQLGILFNGRLVLVTVHRRENHGCRLKSIMKALTRLAVNFPTHQFVLPVHPNPNVKEQIENVLSQFKNIIIIPPQEYDSLICLIKEAKLIMTDSGGIQEEAPAFGVPIIVLRHETERPEGVEAGFAQLVGTESNSIVKTATSILQKEKWEARLSHRLNPYGDGQASTRIVSVLRAKVVNIER